MTSWQSILLLLASFPVLDTGQCLGVRSAACGKAPPGTSFHANITVVFKPPQQPGAGNSQRPGKATAAEVESNQKIRQALALQVQQFFQQGNFKETQDNFILAQLREQQEELHNQQAYEVINQIGLAYARQGDYEKALEVVQKNLYALSDLQNWSYPTDNPGLRNIVFLPEFIRVSAIKARILKDYFESSNQVQYLQASLKTYRLCLKAFAKAIKISSLSKAKPYFVDGHQGVVGEALDACLGGMEVLASPVVNEYAFWFIEQGKALRMIETLRSYPLGEISQTLPFLSQMLDSIETQYSLFSKKLRETGQEDSMGFYVTRVRNLEDQYDSIATVVQTLGPAHKRVYQQVPLSLASYRATLGDEDNFFSYYQGDTSYYLLAADKSKGLLTRVDCVNDLLARSSEVLDILKRAYRGSDSLLAAQLHQLHGHLVHPAQEILSQGERLIIFPDGFLDHLPFGLLLGNMPQNELYSTWPFMILDHPISYDHSARYRVSHNINENSSRQRYLGVAPSYTGVIMPGIMAGSADSLQEVSEWGELIYNQEEVTKARALFGGSILLGDSATKNNFLERIDVSILHLSMHTYVDEEHLDHSGLIFADFEPAGCYTSQGFLSFPSLSTLGMNAEIVLLSASRLEHTALEQGVGMASVGTAFKMAGCHAIAMSAWKTNDYATSKIVNYFTRNLANGLPKDRALRQAKLKYLQDSDAHTSHPYFWGAFVLYGDASPLSFTTYDYTWVWTVIMVLMILLVAGSFYINRLATERRRERVMAD